MPERFDAFREHLPMHHVEQAVVENDDFDGQFIGGDGAQVVKKHRQTTVATHGDDLPVRKRELCSDRLGHCVGHRAVVERSDQPPTGGHLQVATRPHGRHPGVGYEDGVVIGRPVKDGGDGLRVYR
jgi:hypothetical protein